MAIKLLTLILIITFSLQGSVFGQLSQTQDIEKVSSIIQKLTPYLKARTVNIKIQVGTRYGFGSGAIISSDGYILTCAHVSEVSNDLVVVTSDGKQYQAEKYGMNSSNDYSLLKIKAKGLPFFPLGDSSKLKVLQWVIALGHPGGPYPDKQPAVAMGRVRGLHKKLPIQFGVKFYDDAIQTDVPIFAGNSGGPLIDLDGKLIGINGAIMLVNDLAFAVPINEIKKDLDIFKRKTNVKGVSPNFFELLQIMTEMQQDIPPEDMMKMFKNTPLGKLIESFGGSFPKTTYRIRPSLGITIENRDGGIIITKVKSGSLGEMAGLKKNDIIIGIDKKELEYISQLQRYIVRIKYGGRATLKVKRDKTITNIRVIFTKKAYSKAHCLRKHFVYKGLELRENTVKVYNGPELAGYGVIISPKGWILTAHHVVSKLPAINVQLQSQRNKYYGAKLHAYNGILNLALLKIESEKELPSINFGDSQKLKIGQYVLSGGSNTGVLQVGIVSALQRRVPSRRRVPVMGLFGLLGSPNKGPVRAYDEVLQHDSEIEANQFGSPLTSTDGKLMGINVAHFYRGTTFAIPMHLIKKVLPDLLKGKSVKTPLKYRAYKPKLSPMGKFFKYLFTPKKRGEDGLGDILKDIFKPRQKQGFLGVNIRNHNRGVEVIRAVRGYAAYRSGIRRGDIIIKVNKQKINSIVMLIEVIKKHKPGDKINVLILRKSGKHYKTKNIRVMLDQRP